ncbi:MAG: hypothetical protein H0W08_10165 [Acidobacteria bacterium]|nr:hypothetical protein [Acidobacteriota bacterium]
MRRLTNAGASAQSPVLSADGRTLAFVGYTPDGFDLFSLPWSQAEWTAATPFESSPPTSSVFDLGNQTIEEPRPYRPWRMLRPRFWTPIIEADGDQTAFGAATSGADALGRHAYAAGAAWSTRGRPDWYGAYVYDRWRPTLFASASEDTDDWRDGTVRTRELNTGVTVPFRTFRRAQSVFAAIHGSSDRFECADCPSPVDRTITRRSLRSGWLFTTAREYGYSISNEHGFTATASGEWSARALGSSGNAGTAVVDVRGYLPAAPRHGVIAVRAAGAAAWGDDAATREFGAGGPGPSLPGFSFDRDTVALIRGFDTDDVIGRRVMVANADYRLPLAWIERGVGTWPLSLRSLHGAVFADGGAAWDARLVRRQTRASTGVEIAADLVIGYAVPVTVASGFAWRHDPTGAARGAAWFARVGRAF